MGSTHETPGRFAPGESGIVGVFGMDLEGLEVVSGCSKRFIWKLTDISMNSCVDLLSPPAWWCGLKYRYTGRYRIYTGHHLRGGVDWNTYSRTSHVYMYRHHLRGGVDWNLTVSGFLHCRYRHHLRGGVDWNFAIGIKDGKYFVTTCVVVWIEILVMFKIGMIFSVTTCVVVWIEIIHLNVKLIGYVVTTCVVVWIEITSRPCWPRSKQGHHLRGGVDWNCFAPSV